MFFQEVLTWLRSYDHDEWSKQYAPKLTNAFAACIVPGASNFGGNIDLSAYLGADEKAARKALLQWFTSTRLRIVARHGHEFSPERLRYGYG